MTDNKGDPVDLPLVHVSFRGTKIELPVREETTVGQVKAAAIAHTDDIPSLETSDVKLIFQGKLLRDDKACIHEILLRSGAKKKIYRLVMSGVSTKEKEFFDEERETANRLGPRIRDDLTDAGLAEIERRKRLGQHMMEKSGARKETGETYGFGRIETLPNLPDEEKAREILTKLAKDPGVLACMAKHRWNVGTLAELYPEGEVGVTDVCVMGLNQNKGQKILLRLRHEDFTGFRRFQNIKKVLYHELAHNVHSEHDGAFFQLMRQVEKECNELDWTNGEGLSSAGTTGHEGRTLLYTGGSYRLGGETTALDGQVPLRDLTLKAAMARMTEEELEIQYHCGCNRKDLFLPKSGSNESNRSNDKQHGEGG